MGVSSLNSGSFYWEAEYLRPALPFLVINTCSVESEFLIIFLNNAFEKAKCFHSDAFCLFKTLLIHGSTHTLCSERPSLQWSFSLRPLFSGRSPHVRPLSVLCCWNPVLGQLFLCLGSTGE